LSRHFRGYVIFIDAIRAMPPAHDAANACCRLIRFTLLGEQIFIER